MVLMFTWNGLQKLWTGAQCMSGSCPTLASSTMYWTNSANVGTNLEGSFRTLGRTGTPLLSFGRSVGGRYFKVILLLNLSWTLPGRAPTILSLYEETSLSNGCLPIKRLVTFSS